MEKFCNIFSNQQKKLNTEKSTNATKFNLCIFFGRIFLVRVQKMKHFPLLNQIFYFLGHMEGIHEHFLFDKITYF